MAASTAPAAAAGTPKTRQIDAPTTSARPAPLAPTNRPVASPVATVAIAANATRAVDHVTEDQSFGRVGARREIEDLAVADIHLRGGTSTVEHPPAQPRQHPARLRGRIVRQLLPGVAQQGGQQGGERYVRGQRQIDPGRRCDDRHPAQFGVDGAGQESSSSGAVPVPRGEYLRCRVRMVRPADRGGTRGHEYRRIPEAAAPPWTIRTPR